MGCGIAYDFIAQTRTETAERPACRDRVEPAQRAPDAARPQPDILRSNHWADGILARHLAALGSRTLCA
ncbi:MAG: hypothetical protein ACK4QW_05730 [Alphaproteobacteria bacterium]